MARTCEQSLAFRATISPPHLRRKLPRPALPATYLRQLLAQLDSPRPVYRRIGEKALATNDTKEIAEAIATLETEIAYCRTDRAAFNTAWQRKAA